MKVLDRSKPFQEIFGNDPGIEHRYVQDGVKFDNQGREIGGQKPAAVQPEAEQKPAKKKTGAQ